MIILASRARPSPIFRSRPGARGYDIPGFIQKIVTFPDLTCICGLSEILEEADKVLMLDEGQQLLSYDTTFQLGDFYVSSLLFHHTLFREKPCIPAMFLIHERKFTETHQMLFQQVVQHIPSIRKANCCLVTDKERAIIKAVELELPNIRRVQCWNHLFRDIRFWLRISMVPLVQISPSTSMMFHGFSILLLSKYTSKGL